MYLRIWLYFVGSRQLHRSRLLIEVFFYCRQERSEISSDVASLLKSSVGDLKAEWLLMKREIDTLKVFPHFFFKSNSMFELMNCNYLDDCHWKYHTFGNLNEYLPSKSKFLCNFTSRSEEDGGIICLTQENYTLPLLKHWLFQSALVSCYK